jgi:hypothetical protein
MIRLSRPREILNILEPCRSPRPVTGIAFFYETVTPTGQQPPAFKIILIHDKLCLLGYNAVYTVEIEPKFRRTMSYPSSDQRASEGKKKQLERDGGQSSSIDFQRPVLRFIPEDRSPHNHRCENLKFCIFLENVNFSNFSLKHIIRNPVPHILVICTSLCFSIIIPRSESLHNQQFI